MPALDAAAVFERHFLETRCKLLEVAANLDRIDRAEGDVGRDLRREQIAGAIDILASDAPDRAERLQMLFSRPYDPDWIANERMEFPSPAGRNGKRS